MEKLKASKLIGEIEQLKEKQKELLKANILDINKTNIINKRMFEIREQLKKNKNK